MGKEAGVVNVFDKPYEVWSKRDSTMEEALDLFNNKGLSMIEALQVNDQLIEVVSTHTEAATRILRQKVDNSLEAHIDRALDASPEYLNLRKLMPQDEPEALSLYQGKFSECEWPMADAAIKTYGVEIAEGQCLFHGGHWTNGSSPINTSRPFSTSFCPQVALRNAEWNGKAYDAGRVDLMVVRVRGGKNKAYAYSREGNHGNEKEVVFASGAQLTPINETFIDNILVSKVLPNSSLIEKLVPAYVVLVELS
ncbi:MULTISPECIES: hypothetical protein [unclassified Gluconobacter]|uniref:hypothetical protein n=1 Tax=unclassified Gluconobacter TaxID=2644261 RepID=UPI00029B181C|nr:MULTISPECIES: hypothetical protein [unclassified Gluconobacter]GAP25471.1 hypothetical protein GLF_2353 [Gluconobacter frateurii NBRC 101659]